MSKLGTQSTDSSDPGSQELSVASFLAEPLFAPSSHFPLALREATKRLFDPSSDKLIAKCALRALAFIPPSSMSPDSVLPCIDRFFGATESSGKLIADCKAAGQLLQERLAELLGRFFEVDKDTLKDPDTCEWQELLALLAIKRGFTDLSDREMAAYSALSLLWYGGMDFSCVPRIVPVFAKVLLLSGRDEQLGEDSAEDSNQLRKELKACLLSPKDAQLRAVLINCDSEVGGLSKLEKRRLIDSWDGASFSKSDLPYPFSTPNSGFSWPAPDGETARKALLCLRNRALLVVQALDLSCHERGYTDRLQIEAELGLLVGRQAPWVSQCLNKHLSASVMSPRNYSVLSEGASTGIRVILRDHNLVDIQRLLVEQYIDFLETGNPNAFASNINFAAECGLTEEQLIRYLRMVSKAPWFGRICEIRDQHIDSPARTFAPSGAGGARKPLPTNLLSVAHGCRYRDEFFDSVREAVTGVLLEKYLPGFWLRRGVTSQFKIGARRIDFFIGEIDGTPHYLEFHPIVLGRPEFRHDFNSDEEAREYHARYARCPDSAKRKLFEDTRRQLSERYMKSRLDIVRGKDPGARLIHVTNQFELFKAIETCLGTPMPVSYEEFNREFFQIDRALRELSFAEDLLTEALQTRFPEFFHLEWNSAPAGLISRPVRVSATKDGKASLEPQLLSSFAVRSGERVVDVIVPHLFDSSLKCGRPDDNFYSSEKSLKRAFKDRGAEAFFVNAEQVNQSSITELAANVVRFLLDREVLAEQQFSADEPSQDIIFSKINWMGSF
jgi:hypothetical protein